MDAPLIKYPYVGGTRWKFWSWADIPDTSDPIHVYLRRLRVVQTPWGALYVHWIYRPDEDRDPHDHPFVFWSLIVRGGYTERLWEILPGSHRAFQSKVPKRWDRFTLHKMRKDRAHMITNLDPGTITVVFCGPKYRLEDAKAEWGFYTEDGFVGWSAYNQAKYDSLL